MALDQQFILSAGIFYCCFRDPVRKATPDRFRQGYPTMGYGLPAELIAHSKNA